jgi:hypothetical protein
MSVLVRCWNVGCGNGALLLQLVQTECTSISISFKCVMASLHTVNEMMCIFFLKSVETVGFFFSDKLFVLVVANLFFCYLKINGDAIVPLLSQCVWSPYRGPSDCLHCSVASVANYFCESLFALLMFPHVAKLLLSRIFVYLRLGVPGSLEGSIRLLDENFFVRFGHLSTLKLGLDGVLLLWDTSKVPVRVHPLLL